MPIGGSIQSGDRAGAVVAVGVDVGGTKVAAGLASHDGRLFHSTAVRTPQPAMAEAIIRTVSGLVKRELALAASWGMGVAAVGVGTAGVVNPSTGAVTSATMTLVDWQGVDVGARVGALVGLPVSVDNDVNAMGLAESRAGAGAGLGRCFVVAVGTGIGGALVRDGDVDRGATGTAYEVGHLPVGPLDGPRCTCGRGGHLEAYASGPAMLRRFGELGGSESPADFRAVARKARGGDAIATRVLSEGASILGRALGGLANILDPEVVVLGGGVLAAGQPFLRPMTSAFRAELLPGPAGVGLRPAMFGARAGVIGAAMLALDEARRTSGAAAAASARSIS